MALNDRIMDAEVSHAIGLQRYSNGVVRRIIATLNRADADIFAKLTVALERAPASFNAERLEELLKSVRSLNAAAYAQVEKQLTDELRELVKYEAAFQQRLFTERIPAQVVAQVGVASVNVETVAAAALSRPFQGVLLREVLSKLESDRAAAVRNAVRMGIVEQEPIAAIVRRIRGTKALAYKDGLMEVSRRNAEGIVRTAVTHTQNYTKQEFYKANSDLVEKWEFTATLDGRTTITCFDGKTPVFPIGHIRKLYKRAYKGEMVVIATALSDEIRCTPNHPILTARGWLPAKEIKPGDQVFNAASPNGFSVLGSQYVCVPASIADLFDSADKASIHGASRVSPASVDFHGDISAVNNEVNILRTDRDLCPVVNAMRVEDGRKFHFGTSEDGIFLLGEGFLEHHFLRRLPLSQATQVATMPVQDLVEPGFTSVAGYPAEDVAGAHALVEHPDGLRLIRKDELIPLASFELWHDVVRLEQSCNGGDSGAISRGYLSSRNPRTIEANDVVGVRVEFAASHVYNLECSLEKYTASSIIVHNCASLDGKTYPVGEGPMPPRHWNCRSVATPVVKSWRDLGIPIDEVEPSTRSSMDGQVAEKLDYSEWLRTKPAEFQDEVLGAERAQLFRDKEVSIDRFTNAKGEVYSLEQLKRLDASLFD